MTSYLTNASRQGTAFAACASRGSKGGALKHKVSPSRQGTDLAVPKDKVTPSRQGTALAVSKHKVSPSRQGTA